MYFCELDKSVHSGPHNFYVIFYKLVEFNVKREVFCFLFFAFKFLLLLSSFCILPVYCTTLLMPFVYTSNVCCIHLYFICIVLLLLDTFNDVLF